MTFAKPAAKQNDEPEFSTYCSVDGCGRLWAVRQDGDKPKCSKHQWENSGKSRKPPFYAKTESSQSISELVSAKWYDDKEEPF
jgi:hypothetical protein